MKKELEKYIKQAWCSAAYESYPNCAFADAALAFELELKSIEDNKDNE